MYSVVILTALSTGFHTDPPPAAGGVPGCAPVGCFAPYYDFRPHGRYSPTGFAGFDLPYGTGYCLLYGKSYGYSCAGTCHGGALIVYGPPMGPPNVIRGYHTGVAPLWGTGAPIAFGRLVNAPEAPPDTVPEMPTPIPPGRPGSDSAPQGAALKFRIPADAKLYVDGSLIAGVGSERAFVTPPLAAGRKFCYEVRAELSVAGQKIVEEKRVVVEAGVDRTETFAVLITAAAAGSTRVAGK